MELIVIGRDESHGNPFFKEITSYSRNAFKYCCWNDFTPKPEQVILFQWPELVFEWKEPTSNELNLFEEKVFNWKKSTKIIYLVHNEKRHLGMTPAYKKLYAIVENAADVMVHFGRFSHDFYKSKYPKRSHIIIPHPLYQDSFKRIPKNEARKLLNIPEDRVVLIAPGRIRHMEERKLILKAFKYFSFKRKTLLVPSMLRKEVRLDFKGRYILKKFFNINDFLEKKVNHSIPPLKYYSYDYNSPEQLSIYMSAADAVFIPRIDILNSGNLYLAFTYDLPVCGPAIGNLKEVLKYFGMPAFNPGNSRSLKKAMRQLENLLPDFINFDKNKMEQYKPENISRKWDNLFEDYETDKK